MNPAQAKGNSTSLSFYPKLFMERIRLIRVRVGVALSPISAGFSEML
jgi:hypothetical protein